MNLDGLLKNLDKEKLNKIMNDPKVLEKLKNADIAKLLSEIKSNPEIIEQLKKLF